MIDCQTERARKHTERRNKYLYKPPNAAIILQVHDQEISAYSYLVDNLKYLMKLPTLFVIYYMSHNYATTKELQAVKECVINFHTIKQLSGE